MRNREGCPITFLNHTDVVNCMIEDDRVVAYSIFYATLGIGTIASQTILSAKYGSVVNALVHKVKVEHCPN